MPLREIHPDACCAFYVREMSGFFYLWPLRVLAVERAFVVLLASSGTLRFLRLSGLRARGVNTAILVICFYEWKACSVRSKVIVPGAVCQLFFAGQNLDLRQRRALIVYPAGGAHLHLLSHCNESASLVIDRQRACVQPMPERQCKKLIN
jgi:hypothetical protein